MRIEIFGTGCMKCRRLEKNVREAVAISGVEADVVKIEDINAIMGKGIMITPAMSIDGELKVSGRVPTVEELVRTIKG